MARALDEYKVTGVRTTIPVLGADHRASGLPRRPALDAAPRAHPAGAHAGRRPSSSRRGHRRGPGGARASDRPPRRARITSGAGHPALTPTPSGGARARGGMGLTSRHGARAADEIRRHRREPHGDRSKLLEMSGRYRVDARRAGVGCRRAPDRARHLLADHRRGLARRRRRGPTAASAIVDVGGETYSIQVEDQTRYIIRTRGGAAGGGSAQTLKAPLPGKMQPRGRAGRRRRHRGPEPASSSKR